MAGRLLHDLLEGVAGLRGGRDAHAAGPEGTQRPSAFGPFLSAGAILFLLWGEQLIHWYFDLLA
jgi:prepilin signal peptidase PulO-like enzyme (type II secretory pathway)